MESPTSRSTSDAESVYSDNAKPQQQQDRRQDDDDSSPASSTSNKIRRTRLGENAFSSDRKSSSCASSPEDRHDTDSSPSISPLGFHRSEFLPLDHAKKAAAKRKQRRLFLATADTNKLSDDALGLCLFGGFLDTLEVVRLTQVSKRIRTIASQQVKKLDLRSCKTLTPSNIRSIASTFPHLTAVDFSYCKQFGEAHLEQILPISGTLKDISLRGTAVDDEAIASYLAKVHSGYGQSCLESIDLSAITSEGSTRVGDISAYSLSTYCPNLKSLSLAWCSLLTDDGMSSLTALSNLSKLDVSLTGITARSSHHLLQMMNKDDTASSCLTDLDLSATSIGEEGIETLFSSSSSQEEQGELQERPKATSSSPIGSCSPACAGLQTLTMQFMHELTPEHIDMLLMGGQDGEEGGSAPLPDLKFLDLTHGGRTGKIQIRSSLMGTIHQRGIQLKGAHFAD